MWGGHRGQRAQLIGLHGDPGRRNGDIWSVLTPSSPTIRNHVALLHHAVRPPGSPIYSSLGQVNLLSSLPCFFASLKRNLAADH